MADAARVRRHVTGLGVTVLDQLVVLGTQERQLHFTALAVQDAELELLVAHDGRVLIGALDAHPGPGGELVGDLIDERGRTRHASSPQAG